MENKILEKLLNTNLLPLAFLGDSVHTLFVREYCLKIANLKLDEYNRRASSLCKASSQAKALEGITPFLNENEENIVRRARNAKSKHHAKNASVSDYSHATAFEALIGYLYLSGDKKRLNEILEISLSILDKKN